MTKKIYIDWGNGSVVVSPEEYIINYIYDNVDDNDAFEEWLNDKYSASDLWKMDGKECETITEEWKDYLRNQAEEELDYRFDEIVVDFPDEE